MKLHDLAGKEAVIYTAAGAALHGTIQRIDYPELVVLDEVDFGTQIIPWHAIDRIEPS